MSAVSIRPLTGADEIPLFNTLPYLRNHMHADELRDGVRRSEWLWIALVDGAVVARIGWWCRPGTDAPFLLDIFDLLPGHEAAALELVRTAQAAVLEPGTTPPLYDRILPVDWREEPEARAGIA